MTQTKAELLQTRHQGDIRLGDADSTHYVGFKAPATVGSNLVWTLPATDGSANQFLQTNASGVLSWGTADTSASMPLAGGTFTGDVTFSGANYQAKWDKSENSLIFYDNAHARFGSDSDLRILWNGTDSVINSYTAGTLKLMANGNTEVLTNNGDLVFKGIKNGSVELYWDNAKKFETTSTGIAITGAATVSTNLTVTGDLTVSGTTTTINTQTLDVEDKNVVIGKVSSPSDTTADGGGWTLKGATDKTFNWVNSTDAWTSSEHIHLIDNKRLLVGTGSDLQISHSSTNSFIQDSGSGNLYIDSNQLYLRNYDTSNVLLYTTSAGEVRINHNGNQKLETTATGINVTGAINVNGSALSTAPQITATTDGALTAGDAVIIKSDGEVTKAAPSFNQIDPFTTPDATGVEIGAHSVEDCQVIYDEALSTSLSKLIFWIFYRNQSNGDQVWLGSYNATDNSFDSAPSNALGSGVPYGNDYDSDNNKLLLTWRDASGNIDVASFTTSGISSFSNNSNVQMCANFSGNEEAWYDIAYVGSSKAIWVGPTSTTAAAAKVISIASDGTLTANSDQTVSVSSTRHRYMRVAGSGNEIVVAYSKDNESDHGYCRVGTISGTSISFGSETEFADERCDDIRIGYDSINDKYLFFYGYNPGKVRVGTVSGTNISFGTAVNISTGAISDGSDKGFGSMKYNVKTGTFTIAYLDTSFGRRIQTRGATISGTSVTLNTRLDTSQYTTNKGFDVAVGYLSDTVFGSFLAYRYNNGRMRGQELVTMSLGTNLTTENFIGFAAANASDNATATIDVSGATNSNQSSLTAGQKYFVQNNGSLGLTAATPKVFAGTAISATKLIVNDQSPPSSSPLWETISYDTDISGVSEIISNGWNFDRYTQIKVIGSQFIEGFNRFQLRARVYVTPHGGSEAYKTDNSYYYKVRTNRINSSSVGTTDSQSTYFKFGDGENNETWDFEFTYNVNNKTSGSFAGLQILRGWATAYHSAQIWEYQEVWSYAWQSSSNLSGIKFYHASGTNFTNGRLHVIGLVAGS
jgi:hypothetical protein